MTAPIVDEVQRLEAEASLAWRLADQITSERRGWEMQRQKEITAESERLYGAREQAAETALREANARRDEARTRAAQAAPRETPLGTVMVEWKLPGWRERLYSRDEKPRPTGRKGILEVMTPDGEHPDNLGDYRRANPGETVIRLLKSGGSPSKKYINQKWSIDNEWRPEGQPYARPAPDGEGA